VCVVRHACTIIGGLDGQTNAKVNSAFYPSGVGKSCIGLSGWSCGGVLRWLAGNIV